MSVDNAYIKRCPFFKSASLPFYLSKIIYRFPGLDGQEPTMLCNDTSLTQSPRYLNTVVSERKLLSYPYFVTSGVPILNQKVH